MPKTLTIAEQILENIKTNPDIEDIPMNEVMEVFEAPNDAPAIIFLFKDLSMLLMMQTEQAKVNDAVAGLRALNALRAAMADAEVPPENRSALVGYFCNRWNESAPDTEGKEQVISIYDAPKEIYHADIDPAIYWKERKGN